METNAIFKRASRKKLRVETTKGLLSVEQLWDLSLSDLDTTAIGLKKQMSAMQEESFLNPKPSVESTNIKLSFDVVLDVLTTKQTDAEVALKASETKKHNEKIDSLIAQKKDEELSSLSVEELEALRAQ